MNPSQLFDSHIQRAYFEKDDSTYRSLLAVREEVWRWEEESIKRQREEKRLSTMRVIWNALNLTFRER